MKPRNSPPPFVDDDHRLRQRTTLAVVAARSDASLLQYGEDQGDAASRASLAAFLTRRYVWTVQAEHLMVTAGATMSAARREALIAISRAHNLLIMADEVYHLLDFGDAPPRPLAAYAHDARVLSFGSFSKICAPGLRLGWIHSAPDLLGALMTSGLVQSGGRLNPFTSGVVRSLLDLGLADTTLDALRAVYTERSAVLCRALPEQVSTAMFVEPRGGYFVWTELPNDMHAAARLPRAKSEGDTFHPGGRFISRDGFAPAMRLSFAHYDAPTLVEGVERLARAMEGYGRAV